MNVSNKTELMSQVYYTPLEDKFTPHGKVYLITNVRTGEKYVGATVSSIQYRWEGHRRAKNKKKSLLYRAMRAYGVKAFTIEHLASSLTVDELAALEASLIKQLKPEYNTIVDPEDIWKGRY